MGEVQYRQDEHGLYYPVYMDDDGNPIVVKKEEFKAEGIIATSEDLDSDGIPLNIAEDAAPETAKDTFTIAKSIHRGRPKKLPTPSLRDYANRKR